MDGRIAIPGSKLDHLSPLQKLLPSAGQAMPQLNLGRAQAEGQSIGGQRIENISKDAWKPMDHDLKLWSDMCTKPASYSFDGKNNLTNGIQHESSLFSSSLSEIFCRKCKLPVCFY